jgi:hypothetical protein
VSLENDEITIAELLANLTELPKKPIKKSIFKERKDTGVFNLTDEDVLDLDK